MNSAGRLAALFTTTVLGLSCLTACGSSDDSAPADDSSATASSSTPAPSSADSASPAPAKAKPATITIKDYGYSGPAKVAPGTKITVTNEDSEAHTVTADTGGAFDVVVPPGASKTFAAPTKAGAYKFHCTYHSNMHGTLAVR